VTAGDGARGWLALVGLPPALLALATVVVLILSLLGRNPFWPRQVVTMTEAAALRDPATVAWLIETGVDPNEPMAVRPGVLDERPHHLTPAEGAIRADRTEILETLLGRGVRVSEAVVRDWWCLANSVGADESAAFLQERFAAWATGPCVPGEKSPGL
jgi:hypothetical protein